MAQKLRKSAPKIKQIAGPLKFHWAKDNQIYFTISSRNGKKLVTSERYPSLRNAVKGANALADVFLEKFPTIMAQLSKVHLAEPKKKPAKKKSEN